MIFTILNMFNADYVPKMSALLTRKAKGGLREFL